MNLTSKKTMIVICVSILLMPIISRCFGFGFIFPIEENRHRKNFPNDYNWLRPEEYYKRLSDYYDDNFGLRDLLIRLQHQVDYSIFSYSKTIYFDSQGYLYYRNVVDNEQIQNEKYGNEDNYEFKKIIDSSKRIRDYLKGRGIAFKIIIPPQKNEVIPNEVASTVRRPSPNAYELLEQSFYRNDLDGNYVSIINNLVSANRVYPVFYHCDFHWNDWGAAVGFAEVVNSYANDLKLGVIYDCFKLDIVRINEVPDVQQLSSLSVLHYRPPDSVTANFQEPINGKWERINKLAHWKNPQKGKLGKVLFIGDSYTPPGIFDFNNTNSGIIYLFDDVYFCHWNDSEHILQALPNNINLVVIERIESEIPSLPTVLDNLY